MLDFLTCAALNTFARDPGRRPLTTHLHTRRGINHPLSVYGAGRHRQASGSAGDTLQIVRAGRTLFLRGDLDCSTRRVLGLAGRDAMRCHAARRRPGTAGPERCAPVVIDADGLSFVDASGVGAMIALRTLLASSGIGLRVVHPSLRFRRLCELCGAGDLLTGPPAGRQHRPTPARPGSGR